MEIKDELPKILSPSRKVQPERSEEFYRVTGMRRPPPPAPPLQKKETVTPGQVDTSAVPKPKPEIKLEVSAKTQRSIDLRRIQKAVDALIETVPALAPLSTQPLPKKVELICGQLVLVLGMIERQQIKLRKDPPNGTREGPSNGESDHRSPRSYRGENGADDP